MEKGECVLLSIIKSERSLWLRKMGPNGALPVFPFNQDYVIAAEDKQWIKTKWVKFLALHIQDSSPMTKRLAWSWTRKCKCVQFIGRQTQVLII